MKIFSSRLIQQLLLLIIISSPLFALREFLKFSGFAIPAFAVYFNLLKDLLIGIVVVLCIIYLARCRSYPSQLLPYFVGFLGTTALVSLLSLHDFLLVAGGLRWCAPLILLFLLVRHIDKPFLHQLCYAMAIVLVLNTIVQLYQLTHHQFRWGISMYGGHLGRVSGFFELPSGASFFGCFSFFLFRYYFKGNRILRKVLLLLSILNVLFLSLSTTGFILMLLLLIVPFVYRPAKYRVFFATGTILISYIVYKKLDTLNGRYPGDSAVSWNIRIHLLKQAWQEAQFISTHFGQSTNAAVILKGMFGQNNGIEPLPGGGESFYPTVLGNYGIAFFLLYLLLLSFLFIRLLIKGNERVLLFFLLATLGAFTIRITETFPLNLLIAILAAYFLNAHFCTPQIPDLQSDKHVPQTT